VWRNATAFARPDTCLLLFEEKRWKNVGIPSSTALLLQKNLYWQGKNEAGKIGSRLDRLRIRKGFLCGEHHGQEMSLSAFGLFIVANAGQGPR
jgi:hypothetical protein